jgi:hypothetical protein
LSRRGFRDALCDQFSSIVRRAKTATDKEQIFIELGNNTLISVPIHTEDFVEEEAANYQRSLGLKKLGEALRTTNWKDD